VKETVVFVCLFFPSRPSRISHDTGKSDKNYGASLILWVGTLYNSNGVFYFEITHLPTHHFLDYFS